MKKGDFVRMINIRHPDVGYLLGFFEDGQAFVYWLNSGTGHAHWLETLKPFEDDAPSFVAKHGQPQKPDDVDLSDYDLLNIMDLPPDPMPERKLETIHLHHDDQKKLRDVVERLLKFGDDAEPEIEILKNILRI